MAPDDTTPPIDSLSAAWTAEHTPPRIDPEDLRRTADCRRHQTRLVMAGEGLLTAALAGLTLFVLLADGSTSPHTRRWLVAAWVTWCAVTGFAAWNRRGLGRARTESTRSYVALLAERARRRDRAAVFVFGLVAVMAATAGVTGYLGVTSAALFVVYAGWAVWYRARARRDLEELTRVAAELGGDTDPV